MSTWLRFLQPYTMMICLTGLTVSPAAAQNEWLATVDYSNLALNRIGNIPGVTWVTGDNSTYDPNNQRFFFQGNATNMRPWYLYTVNAVTGAVIYSPVCPSGNQGGQIFGLQYDSRGDTLYAIYSGANGTVYFSWIDPATGNVNILNTIPNFQGYSQSTFDSKDHLYIVSNGNGLLVINASTGAILYNLTNSISDIMFDNLTGKLYGINLSNALPAPQFDSITLSNGALHLIASLPPLSLPQLNAYTIDEAGGKYIFLGADPPSAACISNYLYVLDINTGAVLTKTLYPYAQGASVITYENLIKYSFDNKRGTLYALNWHPPDSQVSTTITITASANPVCAGNPVNFTASGGESLTGPVYQWQLNGNVVGGNNASYSDNNPTTGDTVICILTNNTKCTVSPPDTSNRIIMLVNLVVPASVTISSSATTVCSGDTVLFMAAPVNGGTSPSYQWLLNGNNIGTGTDTLLYSGLQNGDSVYCLMTGSINCSLPALSNKIVTNVNLTPQLFVGNDTVISSGVSVTLDPSVTGTIASYQWTPATFLDNPSIGRPIATPSSTITYQLTVTADNGCMASGKMSIIVYRPLKMPNSFTPNVDGKNDVFRIPASTPQKINSFSIYNRWGQRIFRATNTSSGWDGTFNSEIQPTGAYVWMINYEDLLTKKTMVAYGTVILIR